MKRSFTVLSLLLFLCGAISALDLTFPSVALSAESQMSAMKEPAKLININSASATELATLPGIGDKTAQAVIDHRTANGPFKAAEDLKSVKGIGDAKFEAIKDLITVK